MLDITKQQFEQLVIALEQRNLNMGLELSAHVNIDEITEIPKEISDTISDFEDLQHKIYMNAAEYGMESSFEIEESVGKLIVQPDSQLEEDISQSIVDMENAITFEMIVRKYIIQEGKKIRAEFGDDVEYSQISSRVNSLSKKIYNELYKNSLDNVELNINL